MRATDWPGYYTATPLTAKLTRRYTRAVLLAALRRYTALRPPNSGCIVELGGANSCFLDRILRELAPREYHIVDTNKYGLDLHWNSAMFQDLVAVLNISALEYLLSEPADVVFSVCLIEHIDPGGT